MATAPSKEKKKKRLLKQVKKYGDTNPKKVANLQSRIHTLDPKGDVKIK